MGFIINTKYRTDQVELMDDFSIKGEILHNTLDQLAKINKWLGGNSVTLNGLKKILKGTSKNRELTIVDLGCGNGDMLRKVANYGRMRGYSFKLLGIDANEHTIDYARKLSENYPEIDYLEQDIFSKKFESLNFDIVLATLFFHHFKSNQISMLLNNILKKANLGIVINDLHRHKVAYYLFKLVCLTIKNKMIKNDGLISILRGFKKKDLEQFSKKLNLKSTITWKWAFRYQWIITK